MFKSLEERKREKLKNAIKQGQIQDEMNYQEWQELKTLADNVLAGQPGAYEQVIIESNQFAELKYVFPLKDHL